MKTDKNIDGCVFYFFTEYSNSLKNKRKETKEKKEKIYKIVNRNFFITNELTNQKIINQIQDHKKYYYLCDNNKELNITSLDEDNANLKGKKLQNDDTFLLEFEDQQLIYFKTYLKNLNSPTKYILTIINFYKYLLNSLDLLVSQNIFHNHINFDTIVINKNDNPLLSNFMFSINLSCNNIEDYIKHFIISYDSAYIEWTIELHIISYLLTNKLNSLSNYNLENIIHEYISNNTILKTFGEVLVSSYKKEALHYFKKYVNQSYNYILFDVLNYSNTWDNYSLSILFLRILIGIHKTIGIKNKFIILFMKLLVCNIHLNPCKRLTITQTIQKFNSLLDSLETKDYKDVINSLVLA
jgi:hypothetical protein